MKEQLHALGGGGKVSFKEKNTPPVGTVVLLKDNRRNQACWQIGRI